MADISKNPSGPEQLPSRKHDSQKHDGVLQSLVQVESLVQLALLIPCATVIGWLMGASLDHWMHQHWIFIVGLLLGATAGFVQLFRVILKATKE